MNDYAYSELVDIHFAEALMKSKGLGLFWIFGALLTTSPVFAAEYVVFMSSGLNELQNTLNAEGKKGWKLKSVNNSLHCSEPAKECFVVVLEKE
ncbi:hypothetical protein BK660_02585 [Pseudomonas brassicacearum]|uniref:DUF4177 domain-containing protein n=1 Tax=Pseudomonas brassicacearum TaxID=930166 RepID=A0A423IGM1_9PSED|nr:DUF4177 domain-containing protein [Pseudomonas brassicacearum]RON24576.1 hypothetical protein BK660_02585 [Pseudomonas brassicacearum]